jgi:hypothetical protein
LENLGNQGCTVIPDNEHNPTQPHQWIKSKGREYKTLQQLCVITATNPTPCNPMKRHCATLHLLKALGMEVTPIKKLPIELVPKWLQRKYLEHLEMGTFEKPCHQQQMIYYG